MASFHEPDQTERDGLLQFARGLSGSPLVPSAREILMTVPIYVYP
jgi:hypothetical protein